MQYFTFKQTSFSNKQDNNNLRCINSLLHVYLLHKITQYAQEVKQTGEYKH